MKCKRKNRLSLSKDNLPKIDKERRDIQGNKCILRTAGKVYLISETINSVKIIDSASIGLVPHKLTESSPTELVIHEH